jgi:hypothetical protein
MKKMTEQRKCKEPLRVCPRKICKKELAPTAVEILRIETITIKTPSPFTLADSKGVGEAGALAPQAAIINAVEDALSPFDVKISESSIKPYLIWLKMGKKRQTLGTDKFYLSLFGSLAMMHVIDVLLDSFTRLFRHHRHSPLEKLYSVILFIVQGIEE